MKISCILTSYNRPQYLRQALKSIEAQTYKNYELFVVDESTVFDIYDVVKEFKLNLCVHHREVTPEERAAANRLSLNINLSLEGARGDLVCYLSDDDYYFNDWFELAAQFFKERPDALQGFGSLHYSQSPHMDYSQVGNVRFYGYPIKNPLGKIDHSQVMHRRRTPPVFWPTGPTSIFTPDGYFFEELAKEGPFWPITADAAVKRLHPKNFQKNLSAGQSLEGPRE